MGTADAHGTPYDTAPTLLLILLNSEPPLLSPSDHHEQHGEIPCVVSVLGETAVI